MAPASKRKTKSEADLFDQATIQVLRVTKNKARKTGRKLDRVRLLAQGYSERFIAKLEDA